MDRRDFELVRHLARCVLAHPFEYEWTVQGFGMLRCYPGGEDTRYRFNIWHSDLRFPGASMIHDHPWHFTSWVLAGRLTNRRYHELPASENRAEAYKFTTVTTGVLPAEEKRRVTGEDVVRLFPYAPEVYGPGDVYRQHASEIHETDYEDGTVTVNDRTRVDETKSLARVFWPADGEWGTAAPFTPKYPVVEKYVRIGYDRLAEAFK